MTKEALIEMDGMVTHELPDTRYRVTLSNGAEIIAHMSGKMRKHRIRLSRRAGACLAARLAREALELLLAPRVAEHHLVPGAR